MLEEKDTQKILSVSLISREKVALRAVYDGQLLLIVSVSRIEGGLFSWVNRIAKEVKTAQEEGWSVLIEEMGDKISQHATPVLLSDPHPQEARPMLSVALDWYFAMLNSDTVKFQPGTEQCRIQESVVDVSTDEKGRNRYNVDWSRIKGSQRALILACLAAEGFQPLSEHFINELFEAIGNDIETSPPNPWEKIKKAMESQDIEAERKMQIKLGMIDHADR